jgi:hypothetical protein
MNKYVSHEIKNSLCLKINIISNLLIKKITTMYLSTSNCFLLDEIVKSFEVAYRSFVVDILITTFPNKASFLTGLNNILASLLSPSSLMHTHKYYTKLNKIKKDYSESYDSLVNCYQSFINSTVQQNHDVPFVSTISDYIEIFFNPFFAKSPLMGSFTPVEFNNFSEKYRSVRNALSHPASCRITTSETKEVFLFIKRTNISLDDKYFWYVSKDTISEKIENLINNLENHPIRINNLQEITFTHTNKILCRENEITELKNAFFGNPFRNAGSAVVYGYGGLGKTALVLGFIDEIIKDALDNQNKNKLDFILFFTNKEESLSYSKTTGDIEINPMQKHVKSCVDIQNKIFTILNISKFEDLGNTKGIIIIDNLETFDNIEKAKISKLILETPRTVSYIITSREEENCEHRLNLKAFDMDNNGYTFLTKYIQENNLDVQLSQEKAKKLLEASKGNTLILVLSLMRLNDKLNTFEEILSELNSTSSNNIETVSLFMYKNTFDRVLQDINNPKTLDILNLISLYDEPVDVYSISKLTGINNITEVESICDRLARKIVLNKIEDYYELNEFANKFIFIKFRKNNIEEAVLIKKIKQIGKLEGKKEDNVRLKKIMEHWEARNYADTLAIHDSFHLHSLAKKLNSVHDANKKEEIKKEIEERFLENESMSPHPYVKFQKARVYELILNEKLLDIPIEDITALISNCYDNVILTINLNFKHIKKTESYASVLRFYANFLIKQHKDFEQAAKYLDESIRVSKDIKIDKKDYLPLLWSLLKCYEALSKKYASNNHNLNPYLPLIKGIKNEIHN